MSTKAEFNFELWFDNLQMHLLDRGVEYSDMEAVRQDYADGKDLFDVCDEIAEEYDAE